MPRTGERGEALAARLGEVLGEPLAGPPRRLSGGASQETWMAELASGRGVVLQSRSAAQAGPRPRPPAAPLLRAAQAAGVPVAAVIADGTDDPVLGHEWVAMERREGTADPKAILAGDGAPPAGVLLDRVAAALAAVHRIDPDPLPVAEVENRLAELRAFHDALGEPHPVFEVAFRALDGGPSDTDRRTFVHGDYRLGNLLVDSEGVSAVLDWELAHAGDPVSDLGWLCVRAWRFDRPDRPAAGLGSREELLAAYERHAQVAVTRAALDWWELFGTLSWGVITVAQAYSHLSGARRSLEHAVIGRRACEVEWDLLALLDPEPAEAEPSEATPAMATLHDRPTTRELLDATRSELAEDVLPQLSGRAAFQVRVTLRALGIVNRELGHAPRHAEVRRQALAALGAPDERALAAAIRAGEHDGPELLTTLRELTRAKLEAANPRHLQPIGAQP